MFKRTDMTPQVDLTHEMGVGPVRSRRPIYVDLLPPCNHACPAGENIQAWLALAQAGRFEQAWETLIARQPAARRARPRLLPPVRDELQPQGPRQHRQHPCRRALPRRSGRSNRAGRCRSPAPATRQARAGGRRRSERLVRRLSPRATRPRGRDPRCRPGAGRHAAFRHSRLSPAARRPRCAKSGRIEEMGVRDRARPQGRGRARPSRRTARFDAVFVAVGAHAIETRRHPGARRRARARRRVACCATSSVGEAPRLGRRVVIYGGGNTAMDAARTASASAPKRR